MGFWNGTLFDNVKLRAAYGQAGNFPAYGSKFTSLAVSNITGFPGSVVNIQQGEPGIKLKNKPILKLDLTSVYLEGN